MSVHDSDTLQRGFLAWFSFLIIRLVHGILRPPAARNPEQTLRQMGVTEGMRVLEIGCGPGAFTLPAARLLGPSGSLVTLDVNPYAVAHLRRALDQRGLGRVRTLLANAASTGLPAGELDLAFFIGTPRIAGGIGPVLAELRRVLAPGGRIAFHLGRRDAGRLTESMERAGFVCCGQEGPLCFFEQGS